MKLNILKSTTSMVMAISLVLPHAALAQSGGEVDCAALSGEEAIAAGCEAEAEDGLLGAVEGAVEDAAETVDEAVTEGAEAVEEGVEQTGEAIEETADEVDAAADEAAQEADAAADEAAAEADAAAEEAAAEAEAAAAEAEAEAAEAEAAAQAEAQAQAEQEAQAEAEARAAAEAEAEAAAQAEAEAQTEAEAQAEAEAEAAEAEAQSDDAPTEQSLEESLAEESGEATETTEVMAEEEAEPEGVSTIEEDTTAETEVPPEQTPAEAEAEAQAARAEVAQEDSAAAAEAANQQVDVQATEESQAAEVTTETVTEQQARSSGDEFQTQANQNVDPAAQSGQAQTGQQGLSNFEKFALGAAGVLAVGALLNNGDRVVSNTGDRVVARRDNGEYYILKDDNTLLRRPGTQIETRSFDDGSTLTIATRPDGTEIRTIRAADGRIIRRARVLPDGRQVLLIDDTQQFEPVEVDQLPQVEARQIELDRDMDEAALRDALRSAGTEEVTRSYSLSQIRNIRAVRALVPELDIEAVTFDTGSSVIKAGQAEELRTLGLAMRNIIEENPGEVFLVEGHTDAVGSATYNLTLSDRRAESVALALTEYFDVPPENMVVQGYGESNLKVRTLDAERENRRATVRRITPLLQTAQMN